MDIALMREFLELVHYSNFTEAARSIPVSQSTLSKHVQHLERELGCVLIERDKQRVSLTPQGRIVAEHAAAIVSNFDRMKRELKRDDGVRIELRIGGVFQDREVMRLFSQAKADLERRGIECLFDFRPHAPMPHSHELIEGHLDLLVLPPAVIEANHLVLGHRLLYSSPFVACLRKDDPASSRAPIGMADLRRMTFIRLVGNHFNDSWNYIEALCLANGFQPATRECFFNSPHELSMLRLDHNEVFVVCQSSLQDMIFLTDPNLVQTPMENALFPISCYFVEQPLAKNVEVFLEALENLLK